MHRTVMTLMASAMAVGGCTSSGSAGDQGVAQVTAGVSEASLAAAQEAPDPAVAYANANRSGDIAYREGYFGEGDARLHYVEAGSGPLVILYHGFPSFWYSWFDQMEALKGKYRVVAVDGLGSGLSAQPQGIEHYEIAKLAKQLDEFSRHLSGDEKYILIGHDWGSVLALSYAQAYPDRLHKVIGMSAPPLNMFLEYAASDPEQQQRSEYMQRFKVTTLEMLEASNAAKGVAVRSYEALGTRGDLTPEEVELFQQALSGNTRLNAAMNWYRANMPAWDAVSDEDLWPGREARIQMPGLFIWGEVDGVFVPALIDQVGEIEPNLTTVILPGVNHWTSMEKPELATQAIVEFLAERPRE